MGLSKSEKSRNIGRFVDTGKDIVYVDRTEKVWTQQNINDLVAVFKNYATIQRFLEHYKNLLK